MLEAMEAHELRSRRRMPILAICCMSLLIVGLDNTIVNVALPSIQRELHASVAGLQWIVAAYTLVLASLLMLSGSTADRVGRRRTFQSGLALFTFGSLLCSLAPSLSALVAFRMVQAVGGSMLNPVAMSIITNTFTERAERARAIGIWGGVVGLSLALGPVVGGVLVSAVGWRSIFWVNIPVGVAAIVLTALFVPESRAPLPRPADPGGQLLVMVTLAALVFAVIEGPGRGWSSSLIVGCFALAAVAAAGFAGYEARRRHPLLDLRFFRSAPFSGATMIAVSSFAALSGFLLLSTIYLQDVRGYSALHAGLYMLPMAAMTAICSPLSGRVVGSRGARLPLVVAGVAIIASGLTLTRLAPATSTGSLIVSYLLFGLGFGVVNAPITNTAMSGMPQAQAGVAAAVASTSRQVGQSVGVAVIGSAVVSVLNGPLRSGFAEASHVGWWIVTGCGLAVLGIGLLTTGQWARRTAEQVAAGSSGSRPAARWPPGWLSCRAGARDLLPGRLCHADQREHRALVVAHDRHPAVRGVPRRAHDRTAEFGDLGHGVVRRADAEVDHPVRRRLLRGHGAEVADAAHRVAGRLERGVLEVLAAHVVVLVAEDGLVEGLVGLEGPAHVLVPAVRARLVGQVEPGMRVALP
jgi:EmrB/QacA subfamily drug resistance transporter